MSEQNQGLDRPGVRRGWRFASSVSCLAVAMALAGCTQKAAEKPEEEPAPAETEEAKSEAAPEKPHDGEAHHAHGDHGAATHTEVAEAVTFIQSSASVRQNAARVCRQMYLCTYFKPANRGGEQGMIMSAPEDAKDCLLSRNPECAGALDQVAALKPPKSIRTDYMQWAHNGDALELQTSRMALQLLEQKKLKVKKEGDGYQDFWTVWAAKHFPSDSAKALDMNARAEVMRADGEKGLASWLSKHEVCAEGTPCTPMAVEKGEGLRD